MDLVNRIEGRLRALEFMLAMAYADGALRSPNVGTALRAIRDTADGKARSLVYEARLVGDQRGLPLAAFAEALIDLRSMVIQIAATAAADTSKPAR